MLSSAAWTHVEEAAHRELSGTGQEHGDRQNDAVRRHSVSVTLARV